MEQTLPNNTRILTDKGFIKVSDIKDETILLDKDENPHKVCSAIPYKGESYVLSFQGGNTVSVFDTTTFFMSKAGSGLKGAKITTTKAMCDYHDKQPKKLRPRWSLIDLKNTPSYRQVSNIKVDPYTLGFLLGDGTFRAKYSTSFCCVDEYIVNLVKERCGYEVVKWKDQKDGITYNIRDIHRDIKDLGLHGCDSETKFIPDLPYTTSDIVELVSGIMDADGCVNKDSSIEITLKSESIIDTLKDFIERLGGTATKNVKIGKCKEYNFEGKYWRLYIRHPDASLLFNLPRKVKRTKIKPLRNRLLDYYKSEDTEGRLLTTTADSLVLDNYIICNCIKESINE